MGFLHSFSTGTPDVQQSDLSGVSRAGSVAIRRKSAISLALRRWLLRLRRFRFELLNHPAKPIEHGFLNVRCIAWPPESRHRISAFVQRNMVARDRFAPLLSRNEIDEPALRTWTLSHWQAIVQARRRISEDGKLFARLR